MGVGFADNSEKIFRKLLGNFSMAELPRIRLTDTTTSAGIDVQIEMNRPHAEITLLDLFFLEQVIHCHAHPQTSSWMENSNQGYIPVFRVDDHSIRTPFLTASEHLKGRISYCEWLTIIVVALSLHHEKTALRLSYLQA